MPDLLGICDICGKASNLTTCSLCGKRTCSNCSVNAVCVNCRSGKK